MLLTKEERLKFAAYLRQDAQSNNILAQQFAKMALPTDVLNMLAKQKMALAAAEMIVALELERAEICSI